jgi:hypothetical protein
MLSIALECGLPTSTTANVVPVFDSDQWLPARAKELNIDRHQALHRNEVPILLRCMSLLLKLFPVPPVLRASFNRTARHLNGLRCHNVRADSVALENTRLMRKY